MSYWEWVKLLAAALAISIAFVHSCRIHRLRGLVVHELRPPLWQPLSRLWQFRLISHLQEQFFTSLIRSFVPRGKWFFSIHAVPAATSSRSMTVFAWKNFFMSWTKALVTSGGLFNSLRNMGPNIVAGRDIADLDDGPPTLTRCA